MNTSANTIVFKAGDDGEAIRTLGETVTTTPEFLEGNETARALWIVLGNIINDLLESRLSLPGKFKDHTDFSAFSAIVRYLASRRSKTSLATSSISVRIGNTAHDGSIQRSEAWSPYLDQSHAFTQDFAFRTVAPYCRRVAGHSFRAAFPDLRFDHVILHLL